MSALRSLARRARAAFDARGDTAAAIALRAGRRYVEDDMPNRAASLAYFGILSLFPSLLIGVGVLRLVGGRDAPRTIASFAADHGLSGALTDTLRSAFQTAESAPSSSAGLIGAAGVVALLYGASRAFTATGSALDTTGGRRPVPRSLLRRTQDVGWTLLLLTIGIVCVALLSLSGRLLREALELVGLSGAAVPIWSAARYPAAALLLLLAIAVLRYAAPTATKRRFRPVTTGSVTTVAAWLLASAGYSVYVAYIASYNATYGAFAGAVILLLWIWLGAVALLYGAELDAVLDERRAQRRARARVGW